MKNILKLFTVLFLISNTVFAFDSCYVYTLNCITDSVGNIVKKDDIIKASTLYKYSSVQADGDNKSFSCITKDDISKIKKIKKYYHGDLNGTLDGKHYITAMTFMRTDVYINDQLAAKQVTDWNIGSPWGKIITEENGTGLSCGDTYRFVTTAESGYKCVKNCDVSGTVNGGDVDIEVYIETIK